MRPAFRIWIGVLTMFPVCVWGLPVAAQQPGVGLANPASVNCGRLGGQSVIRNGPQGQYGVCVFPDGRVCEEWALFRDGRCVRPPD